MFNLFNEMRKSIGTMDNGTNPKESRKVFDNAINNFERNSKVELLAFDMFAAICKVQRQTKDFNIACLAMYILAKPHTATFITAKYPEAGRVAERMKEAYREVAYHAKDASLVNDALEALQLKLIASTNGDYKAELGKFVEDAKKEFEAQIGDALEELPKNDIQEIAKNKVLTYLVGATSTWLTPNNKKHFIVMPLCMPPTNLNKAKQYSNNEFVKTIYSICLPSPNFSMDLVNAKEISASELEEEITKLNLDEYYICYTNPWSDCKISIVESYKIKGSLIFWGLVMATVDERFYENEMNMLSDMACQLNFTEDMMNDWVKAVKYLLDGNMFSSDMPLEFKTAEANKFFKHK